MRIMKSLFTRILFVLTMATGNLWGLAMAYESRECLECHGDPKLFCVLDSGDIQSISVDLDSWEGDVHNKKGMKCVDCHLHASPRSHPRGGFTKVDCSRCHPEDCEAFQTTVHSIMAGIAERPLPLCHDCHSKHGVRKKEDSLSTVSRDRIRDTCQKCHEDIASGGIIERLARFRISGHRKEDVSMSFDMNVCTLCHQEDAVHGEARIYHGICNDCHKPRLKGAMLGWTHLIPTMKKQPLTFIVKFLDGIVALGIVVAVLAFLVIRYRQKAFTLFKKGERE